MSVEQVKQFAEAVGGTIESVGGPLPDGSGFAVMSMPLPPDHWLTASPESPNEPPMPFRIGHDDSTRMNRTRDMWADDIRAAARYAIRATTQNGKIVDFDPDAMVQNFVVGLIGYWTADGLSHIE